MTVKQKLIVAIVAALVGLSGVGWLGITSLAKVVQTSERIADSAIHVMDSARVGQAAFAQADAALTAVRMGSSLEEADAAAARYKENFSRFEQAWQALADHLTDGDLQRQATDLSGTVRRWHDATLPYIPGNNVTSRTLTQPDALDRTRDAISGAIDRLVSSLSAKIEGDNRTLSAIVNDRTNLLIDISFLTALVVLSAVIWVALTVNGGLRTARATASRIRSGDLDAAAIIRRRDEFGGLLTDLDAMRTELQARQRHAETANADARDGRAKAEANRDRLYALSHTFDGTSKELVEHLQHAAVELDRTAQSMSRIAAATDERAGTVESAAESALSGVQTVAAAAEQLSASINEITRRVEGASVLTGSAVEDARQSNDTVQAMAESAERIEQVVNLIHDIASQTNLLALNATIEAARAGEHGKGFAVVASEVKSLAQQTANATGEISTLVAQIQDTTGKVVTSIKSIGQKFEDVNAITVGITAAIQQQGSATSEIARNIQQTATRTTEVSSNIAAVRNTAAEARLAADHVLKSASGITEHAAHLSSGVSEFLTAVRAG